MAFLDRLFDALGTELDYSMSATSFSPFYSDVGLGFPEGGGIARLFLHYNRRTTVFGSPLLGIPRDIVSEERTPLAVSQRFRDGQATFAFYGHDSWLCDVRGDDALEFMFASEDHLTEPRVTKTDRRTLLFDGYLPNVDERSPDKTFPFCLGLRVVVGELGQGNGISSPVPLRPSPEGKLVVAMSARVLDVAHGGMIEALDDAPAEMEGALARTRHWWATALGELDVAGHDDRETTVLCHAALTLAFNCCRAPGYLAGYVSAFPSRGGYPTHFLWDACFQNLALELMDRRLAPDSLLLLTENLRPDGMMAHFLCSTWRRPHASQPPLVGWAGHRLVRLREDRDLAARLLPALMRNTEWWLTQRGTRYGLVGCWDPLETGWDDTPRLDGGPTLACDMNSYLLMQMRAGRSLAQITGDQTAAAQLHEQAEEFAAAMLAHLYDPGRNLFFDKRIDTGEFVVLKTPACFLPLLGGVPLDDDWSRRMIEEHLLNPAEFYGAVPFPCVAYDEAVYDPRKWWRGPTWMPVAYLMLLTLRQFGYCVEESEATQRLYNVIVRDGNLRELFDSQTGEGMGQYQQGWTAAICLRLHYELSGHPNMEHHR